MKKEIILKWTGIGIVTMVPILSWLITFVKGKQFALRDPLKKSDAIIVLAGTRGNIKFLNGKIKTAAHLYKKGWAPYIIASGKFSAKVTDNPTLISPEEILKAHEDGRIEQKDIANAIKTWDIGLGATYIQDQAIQLGIPPEAIIIEDKSLHTRENAEYVLELLKKHNMQKIILITSPFHQLRTYLTFTKTFQLYNIEIINYYADTGEWHPNTWFLSIEHRKLVKSEKKRIEKYRAKGDLL